MDREVGQWHQPLVDSAGVGLIALLCQRRRGVLHVLLHACAEAGLANIVEFGASVQVAPGAVPDGAAATLAAFVAGGYAAIRVRCRQSEEGGRFHRDENDYVVAELAETTVIPRHPDHIWVGIELGRGARCLVGPLHLQHQLDQLLLAELLQISAIHAHKDSEIAPRHKEGVDNYVQNRAFLVFNFPGKFFTIFKKNATVPLSKFANRDTARLRVHNDYDGIPSTDPGERSHATADL